jgi:hypothetical protein
MARSAAQRLRSALTEFWSGEQLAYLYRMRGTEADVAPPSRAHGRWLIGTEASELLEEIESEGELPADACAALRAQIGAVRHALAVLPAEAALRAALARARLPSDIDLALPSALARIAAADDVPYRTTAAREIEHALRPIAAQFTAAHARAEQPLRVAREVSPGQLGAERVQPSGLLIVSLFSPEAMTTASDLPALAWRDAALEFLARTEAAADDAVRYCVRKSHPRGGVLPWHALLRGLRAPELDSTRGAIERWPRAAAWLRKLGFSREFASRLRAEVDRESALPTVRVLPLKIPLDVRTAQTAIDYGVVSDVLAAGGAAHALGLSLTHPALPAELRTPCGATASAAFGALAAQLWGEREHLIRVQELTSLAAERVGRVAGTFFLLRARALVARALLDAPSDQTTAARIEATATALSAALCCDVPAGIAGLLGADRVAARDAALEQLAGLSLHAILCERFDVDWFRNPRCADALRGLCERGQGLTPLAACEELGGSLAAAAARALQLVS